MWGKVCKLVERKYQSGQKGLTSRVSLCSEKGSGKMGRNLRFWAKLALFTCFCTHCPRQIRTPDVKWSPGAFFVAKKSVRMQSQWTELRLWGHESVNKGWPVWKILAFFTKMGKKYQEPQTHIYSQLLWNWVNVFPMNHWYRSLLQGWKW